MELLDHMIILFLTFGGTSLLFSTMAVTFYSPTNCVQGFYFLQILSTFVIFWRGFLCVCVCFFFNSSHPNEYAIVYYCSLNLHFPDN